LTYPFSQLPGNFPLFGIHFRRKFGLPSISGCSESSVSGQAKGAAEVTKGDILRCSDDASAGIFGFRA
jgi:hypothetical protein